MTEDQTPERVLIWAAVRRPELGQLAYPKPGWQLLMFPDASDIFWGSLVTPVSD